MLERGGKTANYNQDCSNLIINSLHGITLLWPLAEPSVGARSRLLLVSSIFILFF